MQTVTCKKCGREVDLNDILLRPRKCSPKDWWLCIREPNT